MFEDDDDDGAVLGPSPPWLYLLDHMNRAWRESQILKGRDPDPDIEQKLREAGVWPAESNGGHA